MADGDAHGGMWSKLPPVVAPAGTCTLPPSTIAETSFERKDGEGSTTSASSRITMAAPWEWPMSTIGRPSLSWAR